MALAPRYQRTRMLWYYDAIIDYMIANPGATDMEIGLHVRRGANTIYMIRNSDMFKAHWAQRRQGLSELNDLNVVQKTHKVLDASLDAILSTLQSKRDNIPLSRLESLANTSLKALGYGTDHGPANPAIVNIQQNNTVALPAGVTGDDIQQARMAIRQVEQMKLAPPPLELTVNPDPTEPSSEAADTEGTVDAPAPVTS